MGIKFCKRMGKNSEEKSKPIAVKFQLKQDAMYILENKSSLQDGVYVDKEYNEETQHQ